MPLWRDPLIVRSLIAFLAIALAIELYVLARHFLATAPVRQGERVAARAERSAAPIMQARSG